METSAISFFEIRARDSKLFTFSAKNFSKMQYFKIFEKTTLVFLQFVTELKEFFEAEFSNFLVKMRR